MLNVFSSPVLTIQVNNNGGVMVSVLA